MLQDRARPDASQPKHYVFLLIEGFSNLGFSCALETLSMANRRTGRKYYSWTVLSEGGRPVNSWNGVTIHPDSDLRDLDRRDTLVVCAGEGAAAGSTPKVLNWLRREARRGITYGALSSGAYTLAKAGLVRDKKITTHWEYYNALTEILPDVNMLETIYAVDGTVFTCAGGAASMDLMLHQISSDYDQDLANWVADQMVYSAPRTSSHAQRMSIQTRSGVRHHKLSQAVDIMKANLEDPLPPIHIAQQVGVSTRQLERLFGKHMQSSPKQYYLTLRLEKAKFLLVQTDLSLTSIGIACGFKSQSHFSKCYRKHFGITPSKETGGIKLA